MPPRRRHRETESMADKRYFLLICDAMQIYHQWSEVDAATRYRKISSNGFCMRNGWFMNGWMAQWHFTFLFFNFFVVEKWRIELIKYGCCSVDRDGFVFSSFFLSWSCFNSEIGGFYLCINLFKLLKCNIVCFIKNTN